MLKYRTDLDYRPPAPQTMMRQNMQAMKSSAPSGGADAYNAALNMAAYQRAAEDANLRYGQDFQGVQQRLALSGLNNMAQAQESDQRILGSLLGGLFR